MKTTRRFRAFLILLSILMILPLFAACKKEDTSAGSTEESTDPTTESSTTKDTSPFDPPVIDVASDASVYSGTPDTSWFTGNKTEYTLTSADQFVGFQELRSKTTTFEGVTIKLDCDVIFNAGSAEEIKARGNGNYQWRDLDSSYLFKGSFDGQGHTISGIYMQLTTDAESSMFGSVAGEVTFKNFNLTNSYFGTPTTGEDKEILAGLITKITEKGSEVTISNVNLNVVMEEAGKAFDKVAGYVGCVNGEVSLKIVNSTFNGKISITGTHVGGFVAQISNIKAIIRLTSCTNFAALTTEQYCGGMIGQSKAQDMKIVDCINRGKLNCNKDKQNLTGEHLILHDPYEGQPPEIAEGTTPVRVMSFNVQSDLSTDGGVLTQAALNRIEAVKQEILYYAPDVFGLQEDSFTWLTSLDLSDYNIIHDTSGANKNSEYCAIYYKKGMTLLDSGSHWLTHTGLSDTVALTYADVTDPNSKFYLTEEERTKLMITCDDDLKNYRNTYWDKNTGEFVTEETSYNLTTTRKMTYGVFDINGQTVIYVNTHLTHRSQNAVYSNDAFQKIRSNARIKEWDILMGHLTEVQKQYPDALVFFTGDFNDVKESPIYNYITETLGYSSAEATTPEHIGPLGSWNNAFDLNKQGDCYPANKDRENTTASFVDYCFFGTGLTIERFIVGSGKAEITLADGSKKTIYTSDHLPIITDFSFKTQTTGTHIKPDQSSQGEDFSVPSAYAGLPDTSWYTGDKTEYTLTTAAQFAGMLVLRSNSKGSLTFEGVTIKLGRDLIFNQGTVEEYLKNGTIYELQALNSKYLFKGTFDGQGHTISGIYINATTSAIKGLFGGLGDNAVIKNLNMTNCYANGPEATSKTVLGILAARVSGTNVLLSNIKIDGVVEEGSAKFDAISALVGRVDADCSLTVENCEMSGSIKFGTYGSRCGSLVGTVQEGATLAITNSKSNMSITGTDYCGGLVGYNGGGTITVDSQSSYTGTITCPGTQGNLIGNN